MTIADIMQTAPVIPVIVVDEVEPASMIGETPALRAGIWQDDIIVSINGVAIEDI